MEEGDCQESEDGQGGGGEGGVEVRGFFVDVSFPLRFVG